MIPGMNPRKLAQAMKQLGMQQQDIEATEVVIRTPDKEIVITEPAVAKINLMGQQTFQISGIICERLLSASPEISQDDISTVMQQANVDEAAAKQAIEKHQGDLASAIIELRNH